MCHRGLTIWTFEPPGCAGAPPGTRSGANILSGFTTASNRVVLGVSPRSPTPLMTLATPLAATVTWIVSPGCSGVSTAGR